jgi:hypothetical protein
MSRFSDTVAASLRCNHFCGSFVFSARVAEEETMTFNVLVAELGNDCWAAIAAGIRQHYPDASILRVKDGEQAARFLFQRGLLTEEPETPDLVILAADLAIVPADVIVTRLRENAGTQSTPVVVVWRDVSSDDEVLDRQQWFDRQEALSIVGTQTLKRDVADAVRQLCCDLWRPGDRSSKECCVSSG